MSDAHANQQTLAEMSEAEQFMQRLARGIGALAQEDCVAFHANGDRRGPER